MPFTVLSAQALQEMWAAVGIKVAIRQIEGARFVADAASHQFQMAFFRFVGRADPDLNFYRAFHSRYADSVSSNYTRYANPSMDRLLEQDRGTLDRAQRKRIYAEASALLAQDMPYLFLFSATLQTMMRARSIRARTSPTACCVCRRRNSNEATRCAASGENSHGASRPMRDSSAPARMTPRRTRGAARPDRYEIRLRADRQ